MTMNSTISELMQDNSNVTTETNPIATVQSNELIFGQKHNGIECALCPTAKRACDRAWCTAKNLEEWSGMSKTTLWRWLERIGKAHRISLVSDMIQTYIQDSCGVPHKTTLYNLNVLNQLAMACIDNEKLNEVSCKFSDILSENLLEECERISRGQDFNHVDIPTETGAGTPMVRDCFPNGRVTFWTKCMPFDMVLSNSSWRWGRFEQPKKVDQSP